MGLGLMEILIVVIVLLLFFGPNKPAAVVKSFSRAFQSFKNAMNERDVEYRNLSENEKDESKRSCI